MNPGSSIFAFVFRRMRKSQSQKVLFNLALALLCFNIIFVTSVDRTENMIGCTTVAVLLHYFLLVSFAWMLVEAVMHYQRFVKVFDTYIEYFTWKTVIPAWGGSGIVVLLVLAVDWEFYYRSDSAV